MNVEQFLLDTLESLRGNKGKVLEALDTSADYSRAQASINTVLRKYREANGKRVPCVKFSSEDVYIDMPGSLHEHTTTFRGFIKDILKGVSAKSLLEQHGSEWQRVIKSLPMHTINTIWKRQAINYYSKTKNVSILTANAMFGSTVSYHVPTRMTYALDNGELSLFVYHYLKEIHGVPYAKETLRHWPELCVDRDILASIEAGYLSDDGLLERMADIIIDKLNIKVL